MSHCYAPPSLAWHVKYIIRNHLRLPRQACWRLIGKGIWGRSGSVWARICHLEVILLTRQEAQWPFLIMCMGPGNDALGKQFNWVNRARTLRAHSSPDSMLCDVRLEYAGFSNKLVNNSVLIQHNCHLCHVLLIDVSRNKLKEQVRSSFSCLLLPLVPWNHHQKSFWCYAMQVDSRKTWTIYHAP